MHLRRLKTVNYQQLTGQKDVFYLNESYWLKIGRACPFSGPAVARGLNGRLQGLVGQPEIKPDAGG